MVRTSICVLLMVVFCGLCSLPAEGGNHGRTPGVCEDAGLIGSAYAACNVYCEALDCDSDRPSGSERACENALARFEDLADGSLPPCHAPEGLTCPCSAVWNGDRFFPEFPDPESIYCSVINGGDEFASLFLSMVDPSDWSTVFATTGFMGVADMENPREIVNCSSAKESIGQDPDTGVFQMENTYLPEAAGVYQFTRAIFDACQTDLLALMGEVEERFGVVCETVDLTGE